MSQQVRRFGPPALILVMLAGALLLDIPLLNSGVSTVAEPRISLFALAGCWAAFQIVVLYLQFGKDLDNTVTLSVTEVALALGLLFTTPRDLILVGVATPLVIDLLYRRKPALQQAFNAVSRALNVGIALSVYHLLIPDDPLSVQGWATLCLAVTASGLASTLSVAAGISLAIGRLPLRDIGSQVVWAATLSLWSATIAFVAGLALQAGDSAVIPLLMALGALLLMVRGVSLLTERHMNLASIHALGQRLASARDSESILVTALETSTDLLMARDAEIHLPSTNDESERLRVRRDPDGGLAETPVGHGSAPPRRGVLDNRNTVVSAAPLTPGHEVILSVIGRAGPKRPFGPKDARLLDMVAHQTGANLHNAQLIRQLRHDALHDPLTDLPNRRRLLEIVDEQVARGEPVALVWLGLRDLPAVNAALGHATGDELLAQVGTRLQEASGDRATVARISGDEFAILLPSGPERSSTSEQVNVLLTCMGRPFMLSLVPVLLRASAGVVDEAAGSGASAEDVLRRADIAMRYAQRTGHEVEHYTPGLETATSEGLALAVDLRTGITRGELTLYGQPQVRLSDGAVTGVEILVRWNHPRLGLLPPAAFIPLAEQTGLDRPMTTWVLNAALEALTGWNAAGMKLTASVNVSASGLRDSRLCNLTEELLALHGVPGEQLVIEVTESSLLTNTTMAADVLHGLSALGVRVSIDDFGTGFSSLSHLRRLPVDEIKVDMSFIRTMLQDADDAAIVRSVIGLAKDLGLACVAEGVEDGEIYAELQRLECDSAQGYYMAQPMPVDDIVRWMQPSTTRLWTASAAGGPGA